MQLLSDYECNKLYVKQTHQNSVFSPLDQFFQAVSKIRFWPKISISISVTETSDKEESSDEEPESRKRPGDAEKEIKTKKRVLEIDHHVNLLHRLFPYQTLDVSLTKNNCYIAVQCFSIASEKCSEIEILKSI